MKKCLILLALVSISDLCAMQPPVPSLQMLCARKLGEAIARDSIDHLLTHPIVVQIKLLEQATLTVDNIVPAIYWANKLLEQGDTETASALAGLVSRFSDFLVAQRAGLNPQEAQLLAEDNGLTRSIKQDLLRRYRYELMGILRMIKTKGRVNSVAYNPDGKSLASGSNKGTVYSWDVATGNQLETLYRHQFAVNFMSYSRNGKILSCGPDKELALDEELGYCESDDGTMDLWDAITGRRFKVGNKCRINSIARSRDGEALAFGSDDKTIRLWYVAGKQLKILCGHSDKVNSVAYSPDGKTLASGSDDKTIRLWGVDEGKNLLQLLTQKQSHQS